MSPKWPSRHPIGWNRYGMTEEVDIATTTTTSRRRLFVRFTSRRMLMNDVTDEVFVANLEGITCPFDSTTTAFAPLRKNILSIPNRVLSAASHERPHLPQRRRISTNFIQVQFWCSGVHLHNKETAANQQSQSIPNLPLHWLSSSNQLAICRTTISQLPGPCLPFWNQ